MDMIFSDNTVVFRDYFNAIIRFFLDQMISKQMFLYKLTFLELNVSDTTGKSSAEIEYNGFCYRINMSVNKADGLPSILFKFAHEVGHLLVMPFSSNPYASFNKSDKSFAVTTITRKTQEVCYGTVFEELFCNWLAYKALKSLEMDYEISPKMEEMLNLCGRVISAFDVGDQGLWDDYICKGSSEPKNAFMFGVVNCDISLAIYYYDKAIGNGSWKLLMKLLYDFVHAETVQEKEEVKSCIKDHLDTFQAKNCERARSEMLSA